VTLAAVLIGAAFLLALGAVAELPTIPRSGRDSSSGTGAGRIALVAPLDEVFEWLVERFGLRRRIVRAGLEGRIDIRALIAAKLACALLGALTAAMVVPAAPARLGWIVAVALPAAGFLGPDAMLERRARARARSLRGSLPDALDLLATAAAAGRSPLAGFGELAAGEGPLARELAVLVAEADCGTSQRKALEALRDRVPAQELGALCAVIERSRRYGSPLAEQLHEQASSLRVAHRRRIEEEAARAAPKIQLAVALLLVPSVLLMIAAGLLANLDRFLAGI
jgi:tight adherence protein C